MNSLSIFILVVVCVAEFVTGEDGPTGAVQPVEPVVEISAAPVGSEVVETVTEAVNGAVTDAVNADALAIGDNTEQVAQEGSGGGAEGVEGTVAEEAPADVTSPPTQEAPDGLTVATVAPNSPLIGWAKRLLAAKYMAGLGAVYIAVCLYMAIKAGPLVVQ